MILQTTPIYIYICVYFDKKCAADIKYVVWYLKQIRVHKL